MGDRGGISLLSPANDHHHYARADNSDGIVGALQSVGEVKVRYGDLSSLCRLLIHPSSDLQQSAAAIASIESLRPHAPTTSHAHPRVAACASPAATWYVMI